MKKTEMRKRRKRKTTMKNPRKMNFRIFVFVAWSTMNIFNPERFMFLLFEFFCFSKSDHLRCWLHCNPSHALDRPRSCLIFVPAQQMYLWVFARQNKCRQVENTSMSTCPPFSHLCINFVLRHFLQLYIMYTLKCYDIRMVPAYMLL